jgi:hypothetical protein
MREAADLLRFHGPHAMANVRRHLHRHDIPMLKRGPRRLLVKREDLLASLYGNL